MEMKKRKDQRRRDKEQTKKRRRISSSREEEISLVEMDLDRWRTMDNLLFLDLDNYSHFFEHLTDSLPSRTALLLFQRKDNRWKPPTKNVHWHSLIHSHRVHLMHSSGNRHDASDFALVLTFGFLHVLLPRSICFTLISGDKGFLEILHQLRRSPRKINWFNPHQISLQHLNDILRLSSPIDERH